MPTSPVTQMLQIDPANNTAQDNYRLLIGSIVPRPIALVSTVNADGQANLAPFSFFNAVSSKPPSIMIAIGQSKEGKSKDTLLNIKETGEFVVNTSSEWMAEPIVHCAASFPHGVSEFEMAGLTPLPSLRVKPCRVKEAPVHFECKVSNIMTIGPESPEATTMIIGEILMFHIWAEAFADGKVNSKKLQPLARVGGISYAHLANYFDLAVPRVD